MLKVTQTHPLLLLALTGLIISALLPAALAAITASRHAFIGSFEIQNPDGIHTTQILPMLAWPALGLINYVAFFVLGAILLFLMRRTARQRANQTLLLFALVWSLAIGTLVTIQTVPLK